MLQKTLFLKQTPESSIAYWIFLMGQVFMRPSLQPETKSPAAALGRSEGVTRNMHRTASVQGFSCCSNQRSRVLQVALPSAYLTCT